MIKYMSHLFLVLLSTTVFAQTQIELSGAKEKKLLSDFKAYQKHMENEDFDRAMDYVYPPVFNILPRERMVEQLKKGMHNEKLETEILPASEVKIVKDGLKKNGQEYYLIHYKNRIKITYKQKPSEPDLNFNQRMNYTYHKLRKFYGEKHVKRDESEPYTFSIDVPKTMLAVYASDKDRFYFLDYDDTPKRQMMLARMLDNDIIEYFNILLKNN